MERLTTEIIGRVQGVGFRYFVQSEARQHGLSGYVLNLPDERRVEAISEGERLALERLLAALRVGPPGAYVEDVHTTWGTASGEYTGFTIRH